MNDKAIGQLSGLAGRLVAEGVISAETATEAQRTASMEQMHLVQYLVEKQNVDGYRLAEVASQEFGVPQFDTECFDMAAMPTGLVDVELVTKHHALPLYRRGNRLFIAVSDPTNLAALDEIKFHTGINTDAVLLEEATLSKLIANWVDMQDTLSDGLDDLDASDLDGIDVGTGESSDDDETSDVDETPIVRFVNKVLIDAIKQGASDIHFEPYENSYRVRFRTDGVLREMVKPPRNLSHRLAARLKVMSQMDISERRVPQDGRIQMKLSRNRAIDFRVNTLPTLFGEKIVLRILDPTSAQLGIDALGYEDDQREMYLKALGQPQGMILVTGPTGSGKTVSLYTGLNILNTAERNISTAEDPVEINLEGINQVHVNPKVGLNFAEALRSFLRQDPDIIMVGEIRDLETAEIAIKAAQTGHLVLSTLHTNSAAETVTRLLNMGVPAFNVATSVDLIIAQRLARRLCKECAAPADDIPHDVLIKQGFTEALLAEATILKAVGCSLCQDGYKGRVGVYEVVRITPPIARIIMEEGNSLQIQDQATQEGFNTLRVSALRKVAQGLISLEEANRITVD
ncbi:type IV-A pilus assembly ATPase PilB [Halioglobus japonicus]|uniref:Type IV-A pilus assembly ATPase PilB n=1 Tax=Halioglobus japonicus TaxID=930805 RepID=A0AAP8SNZ7_9GAMM|nr:type IV-A pilus assembly ATPase PilB [Halioglobus japonicus]AQA19763.1 type IV-A pilus assembly ATPase PilB [Halioglobus japonicus]PLW87165.1 type IV-A pilus assembly ATPase PilB [Halioglobus japonicus]GHD09887.1 type 4 fimbrial assembly protein PilB [Halioglobus japonicus]